MPINVRIPEALRKLTNGSDQVSVEASNVREMIAAIDAKHPGLKERICDEQGNVRRFVNIFVNEEDIRFMQNLDTPIDAKSDVSILPAIAGGAAKPPKPEKKTVVGIGPMVRRVYLTFDEATTQRPMIYELIKKFDIVPNIRSASATEKLAIMAIEFTGTGESLDEAFSWLRKQGVRVDPIEMNVVEP
ncbi:MAG: MoaD/ThiS family protein [Planctomycetes bacterium]|nr:MoaD/ThiS family protein [Planctomycetota bacterium]